MKMRYIKPFLLLTCTYLLIQFLGLLIANGGLWLEKGMVETIKENPELGVVNEPESITSSGQIFLYILAGTVIILLFIRFRLDFFMKIFVNLSIFVGMMITLGSLFNVVGYFSALLLFLARLWKPNNITLVNIVLLFTIPGIGSWLGSSLGFLPALILLIMLAAYDIVAVFGTKHMVTIAEGSMSQAPLMFAIPVEEKTLGLGTGDLAIPLVFTTSILRQHELSISVITAFGGLLGLAALFFYTTQKKDVVLPALPPIAAGLIVGYVAAVSLLNYLM